MASEPSLLCYHFINPARHLNRVMLIAIVTICTLELFFLTWILS
jgi:hypothetical protein